MSSSPLSFLVNSLNPQQRTYLLILEKGEGWERAQEKRETKRERETLMVASCTRLDRGPNGMNLQPRHVPRSEPTTFWFKGQTPTN